MGFGSKKLEKIMNIYEFIKSNNFNLIIEIGCHFGTDTKIFKEISPKTRIIGFEPDPRNIKILKETGVINIAEIFEFAVSNKNGESDFFLSSGEFKGKSSIELLKDNPWSASNSLKKPKKHLSIHKWVKFTEKIKIKTIKLDDFDILKNEIIDFIWMDVQGAEDLVFEGAKETLNRTKYIYTEYSNEEIYENQPNLNDIQKSLGENWQILSLDKDDVLFKNTTLV